MESASETKGYWPREGTMTSDSGEVVGGLFGSLATREEYDASELWRDMVFEDFGGFGADFFGGGLSFVLFASKNHAAFEDAGAEVDFVFVEFDK